MNTEQPTLPTEGMAETPLDLVKKLGVIVQGLDYNIVHKEEELKKLKAKRHQIAFVMLPEQMEDAGLTACELSDGTKITLKNFYSAKIPETEWDNAVNWLRDNNHEGIVNAGFAVKLPKGQSPLANQAKDLLRGIGIDVVVADTIHPQTLKAFVKEQLESGADLPREMFGVFEGQHVTFKK